MKNTLSIILFSLATLSVFNSCRKDFANEQYTENVIPIKADFTVKTNADITGFVTDENDLPVVLASVAAGDKYATTDEFGYFSIAGASVPETAGLVKVAVTGYFTGYKTFMPHNGAKTFVRMKLLPKNNPGNINAASGGSVAITAGSTLALPANAVVVASSKLAYTGTIHVAAQWIDPTNIRSVQLQSPGDTRGIDKDGNLKLLNTYSSLAVELTGDAGQLLQIDSGKKATVTMPIPSALLAAAPATVVLWSFDEVKGLWKQEGTATKSGNNYTGSVGHFSFWAGAEGISLVQLSARFVNASLQPLANVAVGIRQPGQSLNTGYGRFGFTDANGNIYASVPANSQLLLNVLTPCETEAYTHSFSTLNSNVDLGTLTGNLGQSMVTITGNVVDCNNQPVTNGYLQTYENGFFSRANIVNGAFSFTGAACGNAPTPYVVIDNNNFQQSASASVLLTPGINNLGTLTACGTSTVGSLSYTIDGVTRTTLEPADTLSAFFTAAANATNIIKMSDRFSTVNMIGFEFKGNPAPGGSHTVQDIFCVGFPNGRAIAPAPLPVTITEFSGKGGFISGSFSGMVLDFGDNSIHNISCQFRVRRFI